MELMTANEQWRNRPADERYTELVDLRAAVHGRRTLSRAHDVPASELAVEVNGSGALVINHTVNAVPTHWSFGQLCQAAKAPAGYLRTLPIELTAKCLNTSLADADREANKVLTIRNDASDYDTLQAVTSTKYGRIWDADVVDAVGRIVERSNGRFDNPKDWSGAKSGLYASDHDVFCFMVDGGSIVDGGVTRDGKQDKLFRGFMVWNSETGAATFGLQTFLFRYVCGNHIIWGAQEVNKLLIRHTGGGPQRFDAEALPALASYVEARAADDEAVIRKAQAYLLPAKTEELFESVAKLGKFTRGEIREAVTYAQREEGDCQSLWHLIQGFTAAARDYQFADARVDLERRAGKLMDVVA